MRLPHGRALLARHAAIGGPWQMATGILGQVWFTEDSTGKVSKLDPVAGGVTQYATGLAATEHPHSIALDNVNGFAWWTAYAPGSPANAGRIGRVKVATGVVDISPALTTIGYSGGATGVACDGANIWACLFQSKAIARLTKA